LISTPNLIEAAGFIYEIVGIKEAFFFIAAIITISTFLGIKLITNSWKKMEIESSQKKET